MVWFGSSCCFGSSRTSEDFSNVSGVKYQFNLKSNETSVSIVENQTNFKKETIISNPTIINVENRVYEVKSSNELKENQGPSKNVRIVKDCLDNNQFISHYLNESTRNVLAQSMKLFEFKSGQFLMKQVGNHLVIIKQGRCQRLKPGGSVENLKSGDIVGDVEILYDKMIKHAIQALTDCEVWMVEKNEFLKQIPDLKFEMLFKCHELFTEVLEGVEELKLREFSQIVELGRLRKFFPENLELNSEPGTLMIIVVGSVVFKDSNGRIVKERNRGDYFNEHLTGFKRLRAYAKKPGVECLALNLKHLQQYLLETRSNDDFFQNTKVKEKVIKPKIVGKVSSHKLRKVSSISNDSLDSIYINIDFNDLKFVRKLGSGRFGRVELVQDRFGEIFALKSVAKDFAVQNGLQKHLKWEKDIMKKCNSPFIAELYKTYKDSKFVYLLIEPILGSDVWNIIDKFGRLDEACSRFVAACVVEALEHLHLLNIIYRDLKPENLMIDMKGYVKMIDFGLAKPLNKGEKTNTIGGTSEYMAPEIVLGLEHDRAVDCWTLGVLIYELLNGKTPFVHPNVNILYENILNGISQVDFEPMGDSSRMLVKNLCKNNPRERLGYANFGEIKQQRWFIKFDWEKLKGMEIESPLRCLISEQG